MEALDSNVLIPLVSALIGSIIGALSSIITMQIQAKIRDKRERWKTTIELAQKDYDGRIGRAEKKGGKYKIPPIEMYIHYHLELGKLLEKKHVTKKDLQTLKKNNRSLFNDEND